MEIGVPAMWPPAGRATTPVLIPAPAARPWRSCSITGTSTGWQCSWAAPRLEAARPSPPPSSHLIRVFGARRHPDWWLA